MSVEGVWKVEMLGPYGWERISTALLLHGRYLAAGTDHYTIGRYEEDGDKITVRERVVQDGKVRAFFGETKKQWDLRIDAKQEQPGQLLGLAYPAENRSFEIKVRLTRLEELD